MFSYAANWTEAAERLRYQGQWRSQSTGHTGAVRARLTSQPDGSYSAVFAGRFAKVIPFVYRAELKPVGSDRYVSTKQLGPLLGEYRMQATINCGVFNARFQAAGDNGTFSMMRRR